MDWKKMGVFFSAGVLLLLAVLTGCTSAPRQPENPYLGYIYYRAIKDNPDFKQDGVSSQLGKYEQKIATLEFQKRQNQFGGIQKETSLEKIGAYIKALEQPIVIEKAQWQGAADQGLKKKEKKAVEAYWAAKQPISFSGNKVLTQWGDTLDNVRAQRGADARKAADAEKVIEDLRHENRYRQALAKVEVLRPYKPAEARALVEDLKKEASAYWAGQREAELDGLKAARPYDGAHEQRVMALFDKVNEDVNAFGHREAFNRVYNEWMALLGENWRTRIVQMGADKEYWEAYGFVWKRYHEYVDAERYDDDYRKGLKLAINKGYLEILDNAIRYYADVASKDAFNKGHGKAYVYCCMAKEMYDFATVAGTDYAGDDAEMWYKRITDLEKDELVPALDARVARRLVVHDFERGMPDTLGLPNKLRESCVKKYVPGNNQAWGLEVVTNKVTLAQLENGSLPVQPDDYVVKWNRADFKIKAMRGHTKQTYINVHNRFTLVDNPDKFRKDKTSKFYKLKQIKAQVVDQYSILETPIEVDLSCEVEAFCRHREAEERLETPLTDKLVEKTIDVYKGATDVEVTCAYPNFPPGTKYFRPDQPENTIPQVDAPQSNRVDLLEEDWFEKTVPMAITEDLVNGLDSMVKMYPVELLADAALDEPGEYLNTLGTVLYYVAKLSEKEAATKESAGFGYKWLHLRDQIDHNMKKWCGIGGRWGDYSGETKVLKSLWEECISASKVQDEP